MYESFTFTVMMISFSLFIFGIPFSDWTVAFSVWTVAFSVWTVALVIHFENDSLGLHQFSCTEQAIALGGWWLWWRLLSKRFSSGFK